MSFPNRTQSLADFQTLPEIKILIASLKVGGTGLDITAANKCILVEPWWNDAVQQQAFCRLFRIGQERDVEIVKLVANNTIDDYMMDLQKWKLKEIEGAIGDATLPSAGIEGQLIRHFGTLEHLPDGTVMLRPHNQE
jgi:SNF2 family DNA or RNA helicase